MSLKVDIITPYGRIFNDSVDALSLPGVDGEFGVLEGHSELLAMLKAGVIEITRKNQRELIAMNWGYAKVQSEQVAVLVDGAVLISGNQSQIAQAIESSKKLLEEATSDRIAISSVVARIENATKGR